MSLYRDVAIVMRTYKLGEADRIVVLMTRGRGKVRSVAKGVRRTTSKFGSRLEPGSYIQVQLHEGRGELDIVTQAETVEPFRRTREDLSRLSRASSLLEAVDQLAQDRGPSPKLFDMLLGGLRTTDHGRVVAADGEPIDGLYAVGECAVRSTGGGGYNSGYSLSRAMTFGWLAAQDALAT